ncbi:hypothetical protein [Sedimentibacter sp.]|uniref:hypothetical protein n=1 Tax=Sedimentibacter sp. TaxID=1960295 RepID=UPI0037DA0B1B
MEPYFSQANLSSVDDIPIQLHETFSLKSYMDECEEQLLRNLFAQYKSPSKVAQLLKLNLSNVYRKINKYNLKSIIE